MTPKLPFREVADLIWPPKLAFREVGGPIWPPKLAFREVGGPIWPPKSYPRPGQHPNLTPKITLPGRSIPQFDPQNYILDQVKSQKQGSFFIPRHPAIKSCPPNLRVSQGKSQNSVHFSRSGDRARTPTRKCVAVGHSEERSRPHFDTSKSKITLLEMTPHPSLHLATKSYLQEDEFLFVAKPFCTQKGTPFLLAL